MNKQEIEKAISNINYGLHYETCGDMVIITKLSAHIAISALEHQLTNGWIPVSERLPEKGGYYLIGTQYETPRVMIGFYYAELNVWNYWMSQLPILSVIAWQPLPEPYKEETE
jgi:hypothetical protein